MNQMFGITEITPELCEKGRRRPSFHVRLGWCDDKPSISEEFYLSKYDTREAALAVVIAFRDISLSQLQAQGKWPVDLTRTKPGVTNTSGTVGVRKSRQWSKANGIRFQTDVVVWTATWSIDAKNGQCSFSEGRYGAKAFDMAFACRKAKRNIYR